MRYTGAGDCQNQLWASIYKTNLACLPESQLLRASKVKSAGFGWCDLPVNKMNLEEISALAAVSVELTETIAVDDDRSILVLSVADENPLDVAHKLAEVSGVTGYTPLFAQKGKVEELTRGVEKNQRDWATDIETIVALSQDLQYHLAEPARILAIMRPGSTPQDVEDATAALTRRLSKVRFAKRGESYTDNLLASAAFFDLDDWVDKILDQMAREVGDFSKSPMQLAELPKFGELLLIPVEHCWQIPAVLSNTSWNGCPDSVVHIAMMRRWYENHGARLVCKSFDAAYFEVAAPIADRETALKTAREQFAYCTDNVMQGNGDGTISGLANDILGANLWEFWWD